MMHLMSFLVRTYIIVSINKTRKKNLPVAQTTHLVLFGLVHVIVAIHIVYITGNK